MTDCWTKPICLEMHKADPVFFEQLREVCKNRRRSSPKSALESLHYEDVREKWEPLITPCNSFFKGSCCDCTIPGEEPNAGRCTSYKMLNDDNQIVHVPMCVRDGLSCFDSSPTNCGYVWYLIFFVCCGGCCFFCCQLSPPVTPLITLLFKSSMPAARLGAVARALIILHATMKHAHCHEFCLAIG